MWPEIGSGPILWIVGGVLLLWAVSIPVGAFLLLRAAVWALVKPDPTDADVEISTRGGVQPPA